MNTTTRAQRPFKLGQLISVEWYNSVTQSNEWREAIFLHYDDADDRPWRAEIEINGRRVTGIAPEYIKARNPSRVAANVQPQNITPKGTPGPWSFEYNGNAGMNIYDSERKIIATVEAYVPKPSKKAFATAALIAAAPETAAERDQWKRQYEASLQVIDRLNASRDKLREQRDELKASLLYAFENLVYPDTLVGNSEYDKARILLGIELDDAHPKTTQP